MENVCTKLKASFCTQPEQIPSKGRGVLQVDGYTGYNRVKDGRDNTPIELAYCWAHARRKLFELTINNVAPIAEEGLKQIKIFYRIEAQIKGLSADERRAICQKKKLPGTAIADLKPCAGLR